MLLIKCGCGCKFTFDESIINQFTELTCPQCRHKAYLDPDNSLMRTQESLAQAKMTLEKIPDTAKLTITFDA